MREIKFRVFNDEEMISPDYIDRDGYAHWKENSIPSHSNELMQYTGKKYKITCRLIWESDIVRTKYQKMAIVIWDNEASAYATLTIDDVVNDEKLYCLDDIEERLGNIHENPELLKKENKNEL